MMPSTELHMTHTVDDAAVIIATLSARVAFARFMGDEARADYYAGVLDRFDTQVIDAIISHAMGVVTP